MCSTSEKLVTETRDLIVKGGYNGFSYADLSDRLGIRKASIHHHFPSKVDLAAAVVAQQRAGIRAQMTALSTVAPMDQLLAYTGYWKRCILDRSAPFCLVGVLAAELPVLPPEVAAEVQGFFADLGEWLERVLTLGGEQGVMRLKGSPAAEAQSFLATVYGGMLIARAFDDPARFGVVVDAFVSRIRVDPR